MYSETSPAPQLQQARRRAGMKLGWYLHASVYLCVNLGLMVLALSQGRHWAIYPAMGWGLGLLMHGLVVWLVSPANPLWKRLVKRELRALQESELDQLR